MHIVNIPYNTFVCDICEIGYSMEFSVLAPACTPGNFLRINFMPDNQFVLDYRINLVHFTPSISQCAGLN